MDVIVIFGPPAVGKMAVGMELAAKTGFKLFHNHHVIELLLNFFEYGSPGFNRLRREFRMRIIEELGKSACHGIIFTYVWALDCPEDEEGAQALFHRSRCYYGAGKIYRVVCRSEDQIGTKLHPSQACGKKVEAGYRLVSRESLAN
jgi:hypothetical protein